MLIILLSTNKMISLDVIIPSIVGLVLGIIIAVLFTKYGSVTKSYDATIFGMNSNTLVTGVILFIVICSIVSLVGLATIIRDTDFITRHPIKFAFETILMAVLPTLAFVYVMFSRKGKIGSANNTELLILAAKFAGLHILLQVCGYYRFIFSE